MHSHRVLIGAAALLAACATTTPRGVVTPDASHAPATPASVLEFVRGASVGQSADIAGEHVQVVGTYWSATGRDCRQYSASGKLHVACGNGNAWSEVRPLIAGDGVAPAATSPSPASP